MYVYWLRFKVRLSSKDNLLVSKDNGVTVIRGSVLVVLLSDVDVVDKEGIDEEREDDIFVTDDKFV